LNSGTAISYAGFGRRSAAAVLDGLLLLVLFSLIGVWQWQGYWQFTAQIVFALLFCGFCWLFFSGTPGKLLLGCTVVDMHSLQRLGPKQVLLRFFGYYVSQFVLFLGFFWMLWDAKNQGFHDKMARSVVLYRPDLFEHDESRKSIQQLVSELR